MKHTVKNRFDLTGKTAVITGAAGLLGEQHAEVIAEYGGIPILMDLDDVAGKEKAKQISNRYGVSAEYIHCDICVEDQVLIVRDRILQYFGCLDILIHNAALDPKVDQLEGKNLSRLENFPIDQWDLELRVGLTGAMLYAKCSERKWPLQEKAQY